MSSAIRSIQRTTKRIGKARFYQGRGCVLGVHNPTPWAGSSWPKNTKVSTVSIAIEPKPARDDACRAKHKIKMTMKAAGRIGWHAAAQDNMKFHPKPQVDAKPHHKTAKPRNKAATPATVGEYK